MSDEELKSPRANQARRLKQAKMQRQIRRSQRRLGLLRAWYKFFLIIMLIELAFYPQNAAMETAFKCF